MDGRTDERTQRGVAKSASQITSAECRVRQTDARSEFIYKIHYVYPFDTTILHFNSPAQLA